MAVTERFIATTPERIFAIVSDGWLYGAWVVGAAHVRDVDADWPAQGAKLHHKSGPWPISIRDETEVLACRPPYELALRAHIWPLGEATVVITLMPGTYGTQVRMVEEVHAGPLKWFRTKLNDLLLHYRNREALARLADLAMRRRLPATTAEEAAPAGQR